MVASPADVTSTMEEAFVDLVCADDDLLRAEFDAIIEAGWLVRPRRPRPVPSPRPPDPARGQQRARNTLPREEIRADSDGAGGRERGPPCAPDRT